MSGYKVVVADPPWDHNGDAAAAMKLAHERHQAGVGGVYPRMSARAIADLPVGQLADPGDAYLFLHVTNAAIVAPEAPIQMVCRSWGFRPVTMITWAKHKKGQPDQPSMKVGRYFRGATEHTVFALRGSRKLSGPTQATWFGAPRLPHSAKPSRFWEIVDKTCAGMWPRLELFSRAERPGWTCLGNALEGQGDIRDELTRLSQA